MKRKLGMLAGLVALTLATTVGQAGAATSTYCDGTCWPNTQRVVYRCGAGVGVPSCCYQAGLNACPNGGEFTGTCQGSGGPSLFC